MLFINYLICLLVGHEWEYYVYAQHQERECKYCLKPEFPPYKD